MFIIQNMIKICLTTMVHGSYSLLYPDGHNDGERGHGYEDHTGRDLVSKQAQHIAQPIEE